MENTIVLPPRSSRRNRRVCAVVPYDGTARPKLDKRYRARSYSEMMETKNTCERLALYEKTFELCMRADPQLTAWIKRVKQKGMPKALTEASAASPATSNASRAYSSLPPDPLKSSASRFIATSLSKLSSLSRQPHHHNNKDHQLQPSLAPSPSQQPRRSYDKSTSIVPSASAKIKRRLSSQHQRLFSSSPSISSATISSPRSIQPSTSNCTSNSNSKLANNNNNNSMKNSRANDAAIVVPSVTAAYNTPLPTTAISPAAKGNNNDDINRKSSEPVPVATHSVFLERLRLRRSREPMVGVSNITSHANKIIAVRA
ncbi:hypothetical protein BDB00DRAFT_938175 [Zychaea mexicana]|uniref:uncharacterized protein n=1 Tax=Zychaea mexicana TaxID=64656 RepID=UPI0022FE7008|nr:uncharacterized protein BDB00DRAFT_938175 [Zychaea mexicana]KAI9494628.1 hypothetical protein BDB00DRAFT_938175 [Zychaea mexicana]